ncbi:DinB family protein [Neobacillus cucumis]|uniref:DinB family protein n=1 Tax=Neobacillus cucumis TaxID=1740721 RepID=UPI0028535F56|nr:DinB family protein [Neobacillus cucumis]MDR4949557.1 DinB family protein [Neobacillus cucumis]
METIMKMFDHLDWANQRIFEALKSKGDRANQAKLQFSHILLAEEVWFQRIKRQDSIPLAIWTELTIEECSKLVEKNKQHVARFFEGLSKEDLEERIVYKNSTGQEFSTSVRDILTHVALHGQYHRGQINRLLRQVGHEPVNVDFITFVR